MAEERFPPPQFETGHALPATAQPPPPGAWHDALDTGLLVGALSAAAYLALKRRSRTGIFVLSLGIIAYFGFYRQGCVCSIGSIQNVALALFDPAYRLPWAVTAFFLLPIVFALFFGRVFCGAACPFGTLQDLVLLRPIAIPRWVDHSLGLLAYVYLGLGVLMAATGARFIICEYDPIVPLFRMTGSFAMLMVGAAFLIVGIFIGRPYCRFLCPYGAVLGIVSRCSKWRVSVAPKDCINCRLCESACPVNAIDHPAERPGRREFAAGKRRLAWTLALLPACVVAGAWAVGLLAPALALAHPTVKASRFVHEAQMADPQGNAAAPPDEVNAFRKTGKPDSELFAQADVVSERFVLGSRWLGAWIGLVVGVKLASLSRLRPRSDYTANRTGCVACARCFEFCPKEHERRGLTPVNGAAVAVTIGGSVPTSRAAAEPTTP